jgi:hypothetical protein
MNEIWNRLLVGLAQLAVMVPAFAAASLILVAGYFLARQVERWIDALLQRINFNRLAAGEVSDAVERVEPRLDPIHAVGKLLFWLVMLVVILLASTALGLESINQMFGTMLLWIPTLIAGVAIVILGGIVGEFVRGLVLASAGSVEGVPTVARIAKAAVVLIAVFLAAQQLGVAEDIVVTLVTLTLGAVALATGLAFGLGNRELAGEITRRWYDQGRRTIRKPAPAASSANDENSHAEP